jgi:hypothetical protein
MRTIDERLKELETTAEPRAVNVEEIFELADGYITRADFIDLRKDLERIANASLKLIFNRTRSILIVNNRDTGKRLFQVLVTSKTTRAEFYLFAIEKAQKVIPKKSSSIIGNTIATLFIIALFVIPGVVFIVNFSDIFMSQYNNSATSSSPSSSPSSRSYAELTASLSDDEWFEKWGKTMIPSVLNETISSAQWGKLSSAQKSTIRSGVDRANTAYIQDNQRLIGVYDTSCQNNPDKLLKVAGQVIDCKQWNSYSNSDKQSLMYGTMAGLK